VIPLQVRPIAPADADRLRRFHARLSPTSVRFRFFAAYPELQDRDVAYFTECDQVDRVALVAVTEQCGGEIVGVSRFDRLADRTTAEVAFVVRDDFQHHGVGRLLLDHLAAAAREQGVHRFVAVVLADNAPMRKLFSDSGYPFTSTFADGCVTVELSI
jgi:L-amino acid N-acyltransferase YncA